MESVTIEAAPVVSYAMAHNGICPVGRVVIDGVPADRRGVPLELDISDAHGVLTQPCRLDVDLAAGVPTVLTDIPLRLDPGAMLHVEEQRPGRVRARLDDVEGSTPVRVLAARQWQAEPLALGLEMLAAYVMPHDPALPALSFPGYDSGPERVDQVVRAVFEAVRDVRPIADSGRIRTPGEVLGDRVGSSLDVVVTIASALERVGIRPLIWVLSGHAFLGYWREERTLGSAALTDVTDAVNRVELGQIGVLEAVFAGDFPSAQRAAYTEHLSGGLARVLGVTDVHQARRDQIVPLPASSRDEDGVTRLSLYVPPVEIVRAAPVAPRADRVRSEEPARVTQWKNALLDLSLRNRLVNFPPSAGLSLAVPGDRIGQFEDVLNQGVSIALRAADDLSEVDRSRGVASGPELPGDRLIELLGARSVYLDLAEPAYRTRLRSLAYRARTITEETGANNLYLAIGTLVWELDGRPLRSPLILAPVTLRPAVRGRYRVSLDDSGASTPNYCLVEKLRQAFDLEIPGLAEPTHDSSGVDVDAVFGAVRAAVAARGLPFRVEPTVDLAVLQFAKYRLWRDLDEHWPVLMANPLVAHLVRTPTDAFVDDGSELVDLEELAERCPVPADSSQLRAIAHALDGRTFVLEGPPGTGKSQTITNLLATAVAAGKRVLFVAEKRVALEVVRQRLEEVGLGPLSLDLHDKGSSPQAVREQIRRALEHTVAVDTQGMTATLEDLRSARRGLTRYAYGLHERNTAGLSLYSARDAVLAFGDDVPAMPVPSVPGAELVEDVRQALRELPEVAYAARPRADHPWAFVDRADVGDVVSAARRFSAAVRALPDVVVAVPEDLRIVASLVDSGVELSVLDGARTDSWRRDVEAMRAKIAAFVSAAHPGLEFVAPEVLSLPLGEIHASARAAAASGFFGRRRRLAAVRDRLPLRVAGAPKPRGVVDLTGALVELHSAVRRLAADVVEVPGMVLPADWNPFVDDAVDRRVEWLRWAAEAVSGDGPVIASRREIVGTRPDPELYAEAWEAVSELVTECRLEPSALASWGGAGGYVSRWRSRSDESPDRWLALVAVVEPLRAAGMAEARAAILRGEGAPDDALRSFELGLALASVREREAVSGLDRFDRKTHERGISRFVDTSRGLRRHLTGELPRRVLRARSFDPAATGGNVGLLQRQLGRQRGGLKVRELMTRFGDLITQAMPCVFVSPDSVARFFPARSDLFDIVVFDEASQVRVADAVGAMGRARSVVVVGDSKQMPPTSVAESSFVPEDAETVEDEESILGECVQARVPRHRLTWHYRSQDETLISFSNRHYYDGELSSFPGPPLSDAGVRLVRVEGQFLRSGPLLRANPVEAEAVVAEIRRQFETDAVPSLGVVTFNQQQRSHIEGLLRDTDDPRIVDALEARDGLFVKNLENVQGDERDVILFSTAFSANERGVLPLNFGPLNRSGGERRLNVAVTRARRQVIVFSSFDPSELRAEQTSSVGVKHLRAYLDMAVSGERVLPMVGRSRAVPDRHVDEVADALRDKGLAVRTAVGLSDFKIDVVIGDAVAVVFDGPAWAARLTARDRDGLPVEVLSGMLGWPSVQRVWLPDWLADPDGVVDRLVEVARQASGGVVDDSTRRDSEGVVDRAFPAATPASAEHIEPVEQPFVPWEVKVAGRVGVLDRLPAPKSALAVMAVMDEIVAAEGPIHLDRLAKLVAAAFGLGRVVESRRATILRHVPDDLAVDSLEPVVWPKGLDPDTWEGYRRTLAAVQRPLDHVPLREIANAVVAKVRGAAGMGLGELRREVLAVFGGRRVTAGVAARLDAAVELAVASGRLVREGEALKPAMG
ncbi:DUF3320 domain-containing protein [Kutzneria buriramensis]|uniref:AAA domain-containing protein n=1 Tax=Kutzneria buriramensis TaxID=1045776 RepID=A0A3E0H114_9PSEU|nr:DUF3320 domain-containing protein [Kutzneria buriramensis]REH35301.1 AAA domain-containing protein [Kutzneria buriramensis]